MNTIPVIGLINNIALLLSMALLLDFIDTRWKIGKIYIKQIPAGLFIGLLGMATALTPWQISNEIFYDTCSILFSISGLFFGLVPTLIGMVFPIIFHLFFGDHVFLTGAVNILAAGAFGLIWRHALTKKPLIKLNWVNLLFFGVINHFLTLSIVLLFPFNHIGEPIKGNFLIPSLVFPIGTMLLGLFFVNRLNREKIRQTLKEREEQLQLAVNAAKIGFFNRDLIKNQVFLSDQWKNQLGYALQEIKDDREEWIRRLHPDDKEKTLNRMDEFIKNAENFYELEYRILHKDGNYRWMLERGSFETDAHGKAIKLLGCNIDITNQKKNEEIIHENEQQFQNLAESSLDYINLYDRNCKLVYLNPATLKIARNKKENVIGKTHLEAGTEAQLSAQIDQYIQEVVQSKKGSDQIFYWEAPTGLIQVNTRYSPVLDPDGEVKYVLSISRDITEITHAQTALKKSEAKFRQIFETAGVGISLADLNGNFIEGNPAILEILGYTLEEYCQLNVHQITHPDDVQKNMAGYQDYLEGKRESFQLEKRIFKKNGEIVWGQLTSTVVRDEKGVPLFTIGMFEDITERKRAQTEMKRLLETTDQSRRVLLSLAEDQQIAQESLTKLTQELIIAYDSTLQGWSNALELREQETAGHSKRVVQLTLTLAKQFNVSDEDLIHIERGALLHDIGKMGVPDSILLKPGQLSEDEWVTMRCHPEYAYNLLSKIEYLRPALDIPYCHHERWDGSGYPRGLKGEEIPIAARIFSVIDVWDALLSNRAYRPAWPEHEVISYLKKYAGVQFDPQVVTVFLEIIQSEKRVPPTEK